jgi:hypothetical protein
MSKIFKDVYRALFDTFAVAQKRPTGLTALAERNIKVGVRRFLSSRPEESLCSIADIYSQWPDAAPSLPQLRR